MQSFAATSSPQVHSPSIGWAGNDVTNTLYLLILVFTVLIVAIGAIELVRKVLRERPNLQLFDQAVDLDVKSPIRAPMRITLINVGARIARLMSATLYVAGSRYPAVAASQRIVRFNELVVFTLQDAVGVAMAPTIGPSFRGEPSDHIPKGYAERPYGTLLVAYCEGDGTRSRTVEFRIELVPYRSRYTNSRFKFHVEESPTASDTSD